MFVRFWILCGITLMAALIACGIGYRSKSMELGLGRFAREVMVLICVSAAEAALLFMVYRILHWTHWLQYLVAVVVGGIGYKLTHVNEMDEYQPFAIAIAQLAFFWPALKLLAPVFGELTRRFPDWY